MTLPGATLPSAPFPGMAQDLKDTLQLPRTGFPMRAGLAQREPGRVAHWEKLGLYRRIQERRRDAPRAFVLHGGPPFTNGDVHIGTALNKVLKDTLNRYKSMRGFRTPFVPGWDCHGLPIEQKVSRELQAQQQVLSTAQLRAKCDAFAGGWVPPQTRQFKRLGVLADWENQYKTKDRHSRRTSSAPSPPSSSGAWSTAARSPSTGASPSRPPWPRRKSSTATTSPPRSGSASPSPRPRRRD